MSYSSDVSDTSVVAAIEDITSEMSIGDAISAVVPADVKGFQSYVTAYPAIMCLLSKFKAKTAIKDLPYVPAYWNMYRLTGHSWQESLATRIMCDRLRKSAATLSAAYHDYDWNAKMAVLGNVLAECDECMGEALVKCSIFSSIVTLKAQDTQWLRHIYARYHSVIQHRADIPGILVRLKDTDAVCYIIKECKYIPRTIEQIVLHELDDARVIEAMKEVSVTLSWRCWLINHRMREDKRLYDAATPPLSQQVYNYCLSDYCGLSHPDDMGHDVCHDAIKALVTFHQDGRITTEALDKKVDHILSLSAAIYSYNSASYKYLLERSARVMHKNFVEAVVVGAGAMALAGSKRRRGDEDAV
jgi:hypothetical protein